MAKAGSAAGVGSTESVTAGSDVAGDGMTTGGSTVVISSAAIGSVAGVTAVTSGAIGCGKSTQCGSELGEGCGCGLGEECGCGPGEG